MGMASRNEVTQAFILGAGLGTRLRPMTNLLPKPLMPIFQEPLVIHTMWRCRALGIRDFIINTHHLPDCWAPLFGSGRWEDCTVRLSYEPVLLDSGGGLRQIAGMIEGDRPLLVHNGDILSTLRLEQLIASHRQSEALVTLALRSEGAIKNVGFDSESGRVTDIRHGLGIDPGVCQFTGIYCVEPEMISMISDEPAVVSIIPSWLEVIREGQMAGVLLNEGMWMDVGSAQMYLDAHQILPQVNGYSDQECLRIHPSATIARSAVVDGYSVIGRQAHVGEHCHLTNCVVWPGVSVSAGTVVSGGILMESNAQPVYPV